MHTSETFTCIFRDNVHHEILLAQTELQVISYPYCALLFRSILEVFGS